MIWRIMLDAVATWVIILVAMFLLLTGRRGDYLDGVDWGRVSVFLWMCFLIWRVWS